MFLIFLTLFANLQLINIIACQTVLLVANGSQMITINTVTGVLESVTLCRYLLLHRVKLTEPVTVETLSQGSTYAFVFALALCKQINSALNEFSGSTYAVALVLH